MSNADISPLNRGRRSRNQTNDRQELLERMYLRVLGELCMARFEWKGFEGTGVDVRFLELCLYRSALSVVFKDDMPRDANGRAVGATGQIFALMGSGSGQPNLVDNPTSFTVTGSNFLGRRLKAKDCVPIWANAFRVPDMDIVRVYAWRLASLDRTIEINSANARRNKVLTVSENGRLTAKNINDMLDRGEQTIPVRMEIGDMITALDLGIDPKQVETLSVLRSRVWNECMGLLGINNSNQDKKERLVESEVAGNNDQVGSARRVNLNARQHAAKLISAKYGLEVSVDYYTDMDTGGSVLMGG